MASLANAAKAAEELNELSGRLHAELLDGCGDFTRLVGLADAVGEKGDVLAATFHELDRVLSALVSGDGPVAVEPAAIDDGDADAGMPKAPPGSDEVVSELRAILQRLADLERQLGQDYAREGRPGAASAPGGHESHHTPETDGSATQRENGELRLSSHARNGGHAYDRLTRAQLYNWAQEAEVPGRSRMSKDELIEALRRAA